MSDLDNKILDNIRKSLDSEKWEFISDLNSKKSKLLNPIYKHFLNLEKKFRDESLDIKIHFQLDEDDLIYIRATVGTYQPFSPITDIIFGLSQNSENLKSSFFVNITDREGIDYLQKQILNSLSKYNPSNNYIKLNKSEEVIKLSDDLFSNIIVKCFSVDGNIFKNINKRNCLYAFLKQIEIKSNNVLKIFRDINNTIKLHINDDDLVNFHISSLENGKGHRIFISFDGTKASKEVIHKQIENFINQDYFNFKVVTDRYNTFTTLYELQNFKEHLTTYGYDISLSEPYEVFLILMKIYDYCIKSSKPKFEEHKSIHDSWSVEVTNNKLRASLEEIAYNIRENKSHLDHLGLSLDFYKFIFQELRKNYLNFYTNEKLIKFLLNYCYLDNESFNKLIDYINNQKLDEVSYDRNNENSYLCLEIIVNYFVETDYKELIDKNSSYNAIGLYERLIKYEKPSKENLLELI